MNYNVAQLLKEPVGSQRCFDVSGTVDDGNTLIECSEGTISLVRTHQGIWAQALVSVRVDQACSRCLSEFQRTLHLDFEEEFFPEIDLKTGAILRPSPDWEGFIIGSDHLLEMGEPTRQAALAELPLKPLCKSDCVGICDRCGQNRNENECGCYSLNIDPRWAALRALAKDLPD